MDKRERILDALYELFLQGKGGTASVSEIARQAGIAKGGLYYYFASKEEVLDALVERQYDTLIKDCHVLVQQCTTGAIDQFKVLLFSYKQSIINASLDECLHAPDNAAIHQKSLAKILLSLSDIVTEILEAGKKEGVFTFEYPQELAQIILSVFTFLLDPGIFCWNQEQSIRKLKGLAYLLEQGLHTTADSFAFLYAWC